MLPRRTGDLLRGERKDSVLRRAGRGRPARTPELRLPLELSWRPRSLDRGRRLSAESKREMHTTETLWVEFHSRLRAFVARRVDNPADVDDIVQEVFLRIHQKLDTLEHRDRIHAWVYQIARNAINDYYRASGRNRERSGQQTLLDTIADDPPHDDALPEMAACIAPVLGGLSSPLSEAIRLTELEGMSQVAAARRAGISTSGMKSRVQRARRQVKDALLECCQVELDRRGGIIDVSVQQASCSCCADCRPASAQP